MNDAMGGGRQYTYIENFSGVHEREYRVTSVPRTTCTTLHPGSLLPVVL